MVCGLAAALAERVALKAHPSQVGSDLNWVVVAQRFPVWVRLNSPPPEAMHLGMTASVKIHHGHSG